MLNKIVLRKKLHQRRKEIPPSLRRKKSLCIFLKLSREPLFLRAEHVALYYSLPGEVETRFFLKKVLKTKKVYLPRVHSRSRTLTFRRIRGLSDLERGAYSIREPKARCLKRGASRMDLILVPGVGFDKRGRRLGRGGGYYDRLLRQAPQVPKIGVCFREQLVKKIPCQAHDILVGKVITD